MKPGLLTAQFHGLLRANSLWLSNHNNHPFLRPFSSTSSSSPSSSSSLISVISHKIPSPRRITLCALKSSEADSESTTNQIPETSLNANFAIEKDDSQHSRWRAEVGSSIVPMAKLSLSDQAFFLLAFIACTTSMAFMSLVIAAVPTLYAMGRAAISLSKLVDTAREELPSTMAAIRLSGMEISDLTLEMSDLSQEIADGVNKSAQAVQAAEAGIRQIGSLARQQTMLMIEERANLPIISLQPVVAGAAKKTSRAVGKAAKSLMNLFSGGELGSQSKRLEI